MSSAEFINENRSITQYPGDAECSDFRETPPTTSFKISKSLLAAAAAADEKICGENFWKFEKTEAKVNDQMYLASLNHIVSNRNSNTNYSVDSDCEDYGETPQKKIKLSNSMLSPSDEPNYNEEFWKYEKNEALSVDFPSGKLTLWQFLLELLMSEEYSGLIKWTDRTVGEFILIQAEEVAKLWGIRKDRNHRMNYDKLSRALRYYYQKNIIKKVHGHKFVYRFVSLLPDSMSPNGGSSGSLLARKQMSPHPKTEPSSEPSLAADKTSPPLQKQLPQTLPAAVAAAAAAAVTPTPAISKDFNATLIAIFQAALMTLKSDSNQQQQSFNSSRSSGETQDCNCRSFAAPATSATTPSSSSSTSSTSNTPPAKSHHFISHHHPISASVPSAPAPATSTSNPAPQAPAVSQPQPSFDKQSLLHFSRHSINMQRLSQEILLHSSSKARLPSTSDSQQQQQSASASNSNANSSGGGNNNATPVDMTTTPNPQAWLQKLTQNFWNSLAPAPVAAPAATKVEPNTPPPLPPVTGPNQLTGMFHQILHPSPSADLVSLLKTQLEAKPHFVWMPIPASIAENFVNCASAASATPGTSAASDSSS